MACPSEEVWAGRKRPCDPDSLLLTSGEFFRDNGQASHAPNRPDRSILPPVSGFAVYPLSAYNRNVNNVFFNSHMRKALYFVSRSRSFFEPDQICLSYVFPCRIYFFPNPAFAIRLSSEASSSFHIPICRSPSKIRLLPQQCSHHPMLYICQKLFVTCSRRIISIRIHSPVLFVSSRKFLQTVLFSRFSENILQ